MYCPAARAPPRNPTIPRDGSEKLKTRPFFAPCAYLGETPVGENYRSLAYRGATVPLKRAGDPRRRHFPSRFFSALHLRALFVVFLLFW